jgi:hypothetical protein
VETNTIRDQKPMPEAVFGPERSKSRLFRTLIKRPDFILSGLAGGLVLATAYYVLLLQGSRLTMLIENIRTEPIYLALLIILASTSLLGFGLNFGLSAILIGAGAGTNFLARSVLGGLVGGFGVGCPLCGAFLLSLIGVGAGLAAFPFAGLEFWAGSSAIMILTLRTALIQLDRTTCDPNSREIICWQLPAVKPGVILLFALLSLSLAINLVRMYIQYS